LFFSVRPSRALLFYHRAQKKEFVGK